MKNTKAQIGKNEVNSSDSKENINKIIEEEIAYLKDEIENLKKYYEKKRMTLAKFQYDCIISIGIMNNST